MKKELLNILLKKGVSLKVVSGKLKVNVPKGTLTKELVEQIKANKDYLIQKLTINTEIPKAPAKERYKVTPTQYFMWFTHEFLGGNKAYNITSTLQLKGALNIPVLETAFKKVIERHESLRTIFKRGEDTVYQYIQDENEFNFSLQTVVLEKFTKTSIEAEITKEYNTSFELDKNIPIKAKLISGSENEHILVFVIHHIIGDGWSLQLLTKEVILQYQSIVNQAEAMFPELTIQYKDYSVWLHEQLQSDAFTNKLAFWKNTFATPNTVLELSPNKNRPANKTYDGKVYTYTFSEAFQNSLNAYAKENHVTLFMLLMGGLNGLFYKYTGETDITLGTTVAGRDHSDLEHQIGLFSNALPIRSKFDETDSFVKLITKQKNTLLEVYENKEYPFTELVKQLNLPKDSSRSPLFDIMVLLQNHRTLGLNPEAGIHGIVASEYNEIERGVSQMDATFVFVEKEEQLSLSVEYNTAIFNEDYIKNCIQHLENFLRNGIASSSKPINEIPILTAKEEYELLSVFNTPNTIITDDCTIIELFDKTAEKYPDNIALQQGDETLTYKKLQELTTQLSEYLIEEFNIEKGDFVAIELERSTWTIIAMLAVLKSGGVYVPIDVTYPSARKAFIKEDSNCKIVVNAYVIAVFKEYKTPVSSQVKEVTSNDLAYIIYTSGSTGMPKGVQITHASLADYATTFQDYFKVTSNDTILQQASISFDTSIEEIFPILISGGTLVIHQNKEDFNSLLNVCEKHKISILSTNPIVLEYLNRNYDAYNFNFRILISGGDVIKPTDITNICQKVAVYNTYGPTESTVCATYHHIQTVDAAIPIGKPIRNRQLYILTPNTVKLTPKGISGEICISGKGLSKGYLHKEALTQEKFISHPFQQGELLYRTGDMGKWLPDGTIEFIGRKDNQIKLHGYRIELGEIAHALLKINAITQAEVVIKEKSGEKKLIAYIVGNGINQKQIREKLQQYLPHYMLPMLYVELEALPITANGKIDKKALLAIDAEIKITNEYIAPTTELEKQLSAIWSEILGIEKIGITDNFFEIGGHSLKAVRLINEVEKIGYSFSIKELFKTPTIFGLIPSLKKYSKKRVINPVPIKEYYPVTSSQRRLWTLSQFEGGSIAYNIISALEVRGLLNIKILQESINSLIERHESLRTVFKTQESGELFQYVLSKEEVSCKIEVHQVQQQNNIETYINNHAKHHFDLTIAPLIKVKVLSINENHNILLLNLHHIIGDGWSMEVLLQEVIKKYNNFKEGTESLLPELPIQYKDYAYCSKNLEQHEQLKEYWHKQLAGNLPILELPTISTRPKIKNYNGAQITHSFSTDFSLELRTFCKQEVATLFMGLMAGINGLIYRYNGQTDTILGVPVALREHTNLEHQIGLYLNTLPIRTRFEANDTYKDILRKQKRVLLEGYAHQSYPFDVLVDELPIKRDTSRSALFDVMVILHNQRDIFEKENTFSEIKITPYKLQKRTSRFDITFSFFESKDSLNVEVEYNTELFQQEFIQHFSNNLEGFILNAIKNPDQNIAKIPYLNEIDKERLLIDFNATKINYNRKATIIDDFYTQVDKNPSGIALKYQEEEITYKVLNKRSNQLAHYLIKIGIKEHTIIALSIDRSIEMVVGILGILKSGATYLPLDLSYPIERIDYILENSGAELLLTKEKLKGFIPSFSTVLCFEEEAIWNHSPENLLFPPNELSAYVIYTSGTTGKPKGVKISHKNLYNFFLGLNNKFEISEKAEVWLAVTSMNFDISMLEMLWTLTRGSKVIIQPDRPVVLNEIGEMDFSLFYFAAQEEVEHENKYELLLKGTKFADENGFAAAWIPERHFHSFGDQFPNPSVAAAAVAATTQNITIRSGSVVLPLHDTIRVTEEWAMVDNLSKGRVELSIASGWHPNDFVLAPDAYKDRHQIMKNEISTLKKLWQGETITRVNGTGHKYEFKIHPKPIQKELKIWITAAGSVDTFRYAGTIGANLLTHLLGQNIEELKEKIKVYKTALQENGFDPNKGKVALMLHTFVGENPDDIKKIVEGPFKNYLRHSANLMKPLAKEANLDLEKDLDTIIEMGFQRFYKSSGLFGTPEICFNRIKELYDIGVNEIACLIDYGIDTNMVISSLEHVKRLKELLDRNKTQYEFLSKRAESKWSVSQLINKEGVTHLQSTPSLVEELLSNDEGKNALQQIETLLVGGEQLSNTMSNSLIELRNKSIFNMYGPTETTIWSTIKEIKYNDSVTIGKPMANTQIYILDENNELCPVGAIGELCIGGDGVCIGYLGREDLNKTKFINNEFITNSSSQKIYKTGDFGRWLPNGELECFGRVDNQIKINGHRIELGEIENVLNEVPSIIKSIVSFTKKKDVKKLVGYVRVSNDYEENVLWDYLKFKLPNYMIPDFIKVVDDFPLTLNGKIDRKALPEVNFDELIVASKIVAPRNAIDKQLLTIWEEVLVMKNKMGIEQDFFELGGNSIKGLLMIHKINDKFELELSIQEVFLNTKISSLSDLIKTKKSSELEIGYNNEITI